MTPADLIELLRLEARTRGMIAGDQDVVPLTPSEAHRMCALKIERRRELMRLGLERAGVARIAVGSKEQRR